MSERPLAIITYVWLVACRRCHRHLEEATEAEAYRLAKQHNAILGPLHITEVHRLIKAKLPDEEDARTEEEAVKA